jgi:hypothetical protein
MVLILFCLGIEWRKRIFFETKVTKERRVHGDIDPSFLCFHPFKGKRRYENKTITRVQSIYSSHVTPSVST